MKIIAKQPFLLLIILVTALTISGRPLSAYGEEVDGGETKTGIGFNTRETEESTPEKSEPKDQPLLLSDNTPKKYNGVNYLPNTNDRLNAFLVLAGLLLVLWTLVIATHREKARHFL